MIRSHTSSQLDLPLKKSFVSQFVNCMMFEIVMMQVVANEIEDVLEEMANHRSLTLVVKRDVNAEDTANLAGILKRVEALGGLCKHSCRLAFQLLECLRRQLPRSERYYILDAQQVL